MSNCSALVAGSDGRVGHLRLDVPKYAVLDIRPIGMAQVGTPLVSPTSTPPYTGPSTATTLELWRPLGPPLVFADPGFDLKWSVTGGAFEYRRNAAGDTVSFTLYQFPRSGHAAAGTAVISLNSGTHFTTTGAWTTYLYAPGTPVELDFSLYSYAALWAAVATVANTDARIGMGSFLTALLQGVL